MCTQLLYTGMLGGVLTVLLVYVLCETPCNAVHMHVQVLACTLIIAVVYILHLQTFLLQSGFCFGCINGQFQHAFFCGGAGKDFANR